MTYVIRLVAACSACLDNDIIKPILVCNSLVCYIFTNTDISGCFFLLLWSWQPHIQAQTRSAGAKFHFQQDCHNAVCEWQQNDVLVPVTK